MRCFLTAVKTHQEPSSSPQFSRTTVLSLYGQTWTIEAVSRPGFENAVSSQEPQLVLLGGILVSILTAIVSFMLSVNKEKVAALAHANVELLSAIEEQQIATRARQEADMRIRQQASLLDKATDAIIVRGRSSHSVLESRRPAALWMETRRGDRQIRRRSALSRDRAFP